jgi:hypothetical protein
LVITEDSRYTYAVKEADFVITVKYIPGTHKLFKKIDLFILKIPGIDLFILKIPGIDLFILKILGIVLFILKIPGLRQLFKKTDFAVTVKYIPDTHQLFKTIGLFILKIPGVHQLFKKTDLVTTGNSRYKSAL